MNETNQRLERLFRAAARHKERTPAEVPFAVEARALAAWRGAVAANGWLAALPLFRRACAVACAITAAVVVLSYAAAPAPVPEAQAMADSALQLALNP